MRAARFVFPALLFSALAAVVPDSAAPSVAAAAEAEVGRADSTRGRFFWRGRPLPECRSFLITEFGIHYQLNVEDGPYQDRSLFVTGDLGYMRNRTKHDAMGGLVHLGSGGSFTGLGPGIRYRRWLSEDLSTDFTIGVDLIGSADRGFGLGGPAPWAEIGFSAADIVTISIRGEHWTREEGWTFPDGSQVPKTVTFWHVGAKGGSYFAAGGVAVGVVAYAVLIAVLIGSSN